MAKKAKASKDGCELKPGDEVQGCYTDANGDEQHVQGIVHCIGDDGNAMVMFSHLHCVSVDLCNLTRVSC